MLEKIVKDKKLLKKIKKRLYVNTCAEFAAKVIAYGIDTVPRMCETIDLTQQEFAELFEKIKSSLPEDTLTLLEENIPVENLYFGALKPEKDGDLNEQR